MMLRRHDRYILKAFWGTFGAVLLFFTVVSVVIHLAERTGRLIRYWDRLENMGYDPIGIIAQFYATLIPFIWIQFLPLAVVLAAAFALTRLTKHHELTPLVTAGVSIRRLTLPILLSGVLIAGLLMVMKETVVPSLNRQHQRLYRLLSKSHPDRITEVPHFQDPSGARLSMAAYLPLRRRIEGALLTFREAGGDVESVHTYPVLTWSEDSRNWIAERGGTRFPLDQDPTGGIRRPIPENAVAPLDSDIRLVEVSITRKVALGLSSRDTAALMRADPDNTRLVMLHHAQFTRPLSAVVLLLLSLPFCLRLMSRSALPGIVAGLVGSALYYGTGFLASGMSGPGDLNPVVLAWAPTVLFGSLGAALYFGMDG
ncbi:MAG: LptF/LptG family permease [Planctomycetota bacterium]|jgi:lipopolysaccharide export system permease protein